MTTGTDEDVSANLAFVKALVSEGGRAQMSGGAIFLAGGCATASSACSTGRHPRLAARRRAGQPLHRHRADGGFLRRPGRYHLAPTAKTASTA
ncbi:MAG: hypothetical protein WDN06_11280 [Asticcacaulis sp.]